MAIHQDSPFAARRTRQAVLPPLPAEPACRVRLKPLSLKTARGPFTATDGARSVRKRLRVVLLYREGDHVAPVRTLGEETCLICSFSYVAPHLRDPLRRTERLSSAPVEFVYPSTGSVGAESGGVLRLSAFGVLDGNVVRAVERMCGPDEEEIVLLIGDRELCFVPGELAGRPAMRGPAFQKRGGADQNRTGDRGFADRSLSHLGTAP